MKRHHIWALMCVGLFLFWGCVVVAIAKADDCAELWNYCADNVRAEQIKSNQFAELIRSLGGEVEDVEILGELPVIESAGARCAYAGACGYTRLEAQMEADRRYLLLHELSAAQAEKVKALTKKCGKRCRKIK